MNYRKIYEEHYGLIPVDNDGRSYEIHHIDGDKNNNHPLNLQALSIYDHYMIHYQKGDYNACKLIASRSKMNPELISELSTKANQKRIENGTHNFLGPHNNASRVQNGTHNFLGPESNKRKIAKGVHVSQNPIRRAEQRERAKRWANAAVRNGTHNFLGGEIQRRSNQRRLENGTHPFQQPWTCPSCLKTGIGLTNAKRWHFENCRNVKT